MEAIPLCPSLLFDCNSNIPSVHVAAPRKNELRPLFPSSFSLLHYYAGLCIDQLKPEDRDTYRNLLAKILIQHQEPDGCWWDYTLYNYYKQYGTAFAMMSMQRCLPESEQKKTDTIRQ